MVIFEEEMRLASHELFVMTDDGSYGRHGLVTEKLQELIAERQAIHHVFAIGPIPMMRAVAKVTRPYRIATTVSLNPIMVDGTGMCGGCRVLINGESRFACIDGPEFEAHAVDFEVLAQRNQLYRSQEQAALERFESLRQNEPEKSFTCHLAELIAESTQP
jgi:ferredoxin--NADP+ reductase